MWGISGLGLGVSTALWDHLSRYSSKAPSALAEKVYSRVPRTPCPSKTPRTRSPEHQDPRARNLKAGLIYGLQDLFHTPAGSDSSFCAQSEKPLFPFLHQRCRGWVGGSPLSLEPTGVKHYAREARLPRFTHRQARTLPFARRAKKPLFPFLHQRCTPPPSQQSLHQQGLSVTKRDTTRTRRVGGWGPRGPQALGKPLTGVMSAAAIRAAVFADAFRDVQR